MAPRAEVAAKARVMLGAAVVLGLASCVRAPASLWRVEVPETP